MALAVAVGSGLDFTAARSRGASPPPASTTATGTAAATTATAPAANSARRRRRGVAGPGGGGRSGSLVVTAGGRSTVGGVGGRSGGGAVVAAARSGGPDGPVGGRGGAARRSAPGCTGSAGSGTGVARVPPATVDQRSVVGARPGRRGRRGGRVAFEARVASPARAGDLEQVLLELLPGGTRGLRALGRLLREQAVDPAGERARDRGRAVGERWRLSRQCANSTASGSSALNGTDPESSSYAITPTEYRSVHGPISCAIACSGAMYAGVPTAMPVAVWNIVTRSSASARAMPKSAIFTRPSTLTSRFSGLRSRCTTPAACACASPASTLSSTPPSWAGSSRPTHGRSEPRGTYSMAM